jgi:hypothetical protein
VFRQDPDGRQHQVDEHNWKGSQMVTRCIKFIAGWILLATSAAFAQEVKVIPTNEPFAVVPGSYFYLAIIVGVILAISFELILTHLSVAAGITAVGPFDRRKARTPRQASESQEARKEESTVMETVTRTSNIFGVWTLVTAVISLFFASWLAVRLSTSLDAWHGIVLGLAIWAMFYIFMTTLQVTALTSLVGSLVQTAIGGLKAAYKATTSVFGKSEEDRIVDTAEKVTASVRDELFGDVDVKDLRKDIEHYVQQLKPASPREFKNAIRELLDETDIRAIVEHNEGPFAGTDVLTASLVKESGMSREKARTTAAGIQDAIAKIREEYSSQKDTTSKVSDAAMRVAGKSPEEAQAIREQIETYLRETHKEELDPEGIKRDLEKLLTRPKEGLGALRDRLAAFDRSTLTAILAQRKDLSQQEAQKITDRVMSVVDTLRGKARETSEGASNWAQSIEAKISNYLNSMERPELEYEGIKHDLQVLFHDPKAGADLLIHRLKAMDRETLKAIVASRKDMTEDDAERLVLNMERARDEAIEKYQEMKVEVQHRLDDARDRALREAEEARQAARAAAWWTFGAAVLSGASAIGGGILSTLR